MKRTLALLDQSRAALETCGYCPKLCRAACPVSEAEPRDSLTPWGKMSLAWFAARGDVEPDRDLAATAWACTGCFSCREHCDHRNEVAHTLGAARAEFRALGLAPAASEAVIAGFEAQRHATTEALATLAREPGVQATADTALLVGCGYATRHPAQARSAIAVTTRLFGAVRLVDGCCGLPLLLAGDRAGFAQSLSRLSEQVRGAPRFVVLDPGCALVLSEHGAKTLVELAATRLDAFHRVPRLAEYAAVRWQDPCKLGRGLGIYDAPRQLLSRALGRAPEELARIRGEALCSGGGGLLPQTMPEVAARIAERRLDEHRQVGGGLLVTGCASSLESLQNRGVEVADLVSILDEASRPTDG
ncbi:MAG: (Fe-S)-binding protein [Polyangiaceae bacterium]|nr:(Fe-S)-binding protein [Polyangiaceae bacterium]